MRVSPSTLESAQAALSVFIGLIVFAQVVAFSLWRHLHEPYALGETEIPGFLVLSIPIAFMAVGLGWLLRSLARAWVKIALAFVLGWAIGIGCGLIVAFTLSGPGVFSIPVLRTWGLGAALASAVVANWQATNPLIGVVRLIVIGVGAWMLVAVHDPVFLWATDSTEANVYLFALRSSGSGLDLDFDPMEVPDELVALMSASGLEGQLKLTRRGSFGRGRPVNIGIVYGIPEQVPSATLAQPEQGSLLYIQSGEGFENHPEYPALSSRKILLKTEEWSGRAVARFELRSGAFTGMALDWPREWSGDKW